MKWRTFVTFASLWTTFMAFFAAFSLSVRPEHMVGDVVYAIGVWGWCLTMLVELFILSKRCMEREAKEDGHMVITLRSEPGETPILTRHGSLVSTLCLAIMMVGWGLSLFFHI